MTVLIPGMVLKPLDESAPISGLHRVLYAQESSDYIVLIALAPRRVNKRTYFLGYVTFSYRIILRWVDANAPLIAVTTVAPRPDYLASDEDLDKAYRRKGQEKSATRREREKRWALIAPLVSGVDKTLLFDREMLRDQIRRRAEQLSGDAKDIARCSRRIQDYLNQYWAGGSTDRALTPYFGACGHRGAPREQQTKLGRPNLPTAAGAEGVEGYWLTEDDKKNLQFGWRNYYIRGSTLEKAFRKMARAFYSEAVTDAQGNTHTKLYPANERPTKDQFAYWGQKQSPGEAAWKKLLTRTNLARIDRALIGRATDDIFAVGQRACVDSSPPDMHLVSTVRRLDRIGTAHRILVVDSCYRYIPGFYLGLLPPSALTVNLAFLHAMTPKADWLKFLGLVDQCPDDWLPIAFSSALADNTDARAENVFVSLDSIGTGQLYIPVARSDLNSPVEVSHHQLHRMVDHNLAGTTRGRRCAERGEARAEDLARHTIIEAIRETARAIHTFNTMPLDIQPTLEMRRDLVDKGIPLTRLSLTRWRINQGRIARTLITVAEARTLLLPIVRGTFTASGVKLLRPDTGDKRVFVQSLRYVSNHPLMLEKFKQAKNERGKFDITAYDDDFRHDPYNPTEVFYRNPADGELIRLEYRGEDRDLPYECSHYDVLDVETRHCVERHAVAEAREQALSTMEAGQEHAVATAQDAYDQALEAEPKKPSTAALRRNKEQNRQSEAERCTYGMPEQRPPASNPGGSVSCEPDAESSTAALLPEAAAIGGSRDEAMAPAEAIVEQPPRARSVFARAVSKCP